MPIQPTLDTEIETLTQAIASKREHITRAQYIAEVQPMKDELVALIAENEIIKAANKVIEDTPTAEELAIKAADERRQNIKNDIRILHPELSDEVQELRMILAEEFPSNDRAQEYNSKIEAILAKYPKV